MRLPPTAILALLFAGLIIVGAALLKLPIAATKPITWSDVLFTATSAVTVTGLGVLDTGADFTRFGHVVLLILIQLGGLGMMTFTVMVFALLGKRLGISQQMLLREDLNQTSFGDLMRLVRVIATVVVTTELAGTVLLAVRFVPQFGLAEGAFQALFHAISAFNNAGFGLFPDSLTRWATDPWINAVVAVLIVMGGIGFSVLDEIYHRRQWKRMSLYTRLTLAGTAVLLTWSFAAFAAAEWNNPKTLGRFASIADRLIVAGFQAVSVRTAGFNSVDMAALTDGTTLMFLTMMFIGGGSTSTAGGIKVTSFVVLVIAAVAFARGSTSPNVWGRTIHPADILRVLALAVMSLGFVITGFFVLTMTQPLAFVDLLFETFSAFGTVGLTRNTTGQLDDTGRLVIMVLMFIGRIGPLALGLILARKLASEIRYPRGRVYLG